MVCTQTSQPSEKAGLAALLWQDLDGLGVSTYCKTAAASGGCPCVQLCQHTGRGAQSLRDSSRRVSWTSELRGLSSALCMLLRLQLQAGAPHAACHVLAQNTCKPPESIARGAQSSRDSCRRVSWTSSLATSPARCACSSACSCRQVRPCSASWCAACSCCRRAACVFVDALASCCAAASRACRTCKYQLCVQGCYAAELRCMAVQPL